MSKTQSEMKKTTITIRAAKYHSVTQTGNVDIYKEHFIHKIALILRSSRSSYVESFLHQLERIEPEILEY